MKQIGVDCQVDLNNGFYIIFSAHFIPINRDSTLIPPIVGFSSSARKHRLREECLNKLLLKTRPKIPKIVIFLNKNSVEVLEIKNTDSGIRYHPTTLKSYKSKMLV